MLGLEFEEALVKVAINSGRMENVEPLNLLLVGGAGVGKTTLLEMFRGTVGTIYLSDIDAAGLRRALLFAERNGTLKHKKHILIPDLTRVFSRKQSTIANTLSFLTMLIEDGLGDSAIYAQKPEEAFKHQGKEKPIRLGVISAITTEAYDYICNEIPLLKDTLLTRFIIRRLDDYSANVKDEISSQLMSRAVPMLEQPIIILPSKNRNSYEFPKIGLRDFGQKGVETMRDWRVLLDFMATYEVVASYQRSSNRLLLAKRGKNWENPLPQLVYIYKQGQEGGIINSVSSIADARVREALATNPVREGYVGINEFDELLTHTFNHYVNFGKTTVDVREAINVLRARKNNGGI